MKEEFYVGERVYISTDSLNPFHYGDTGTVIEGSDGSSWCSVRWDRRIKDGHTCNGLCENGHGLYMCVGFLRHVEGNDINDEDIADINDLYDFIIE